MTSPKKYDVVSFSAASIDITILAEDAYLTQHALSKGLSSPITSEKLKEIVENAADITKTPGSPGANVAVGIALRGGNAALVGKISNDHHGVFITDRIQSHGVDFVPLVTEKAELATNVVLSLTTPDKERTFAFAGGAAYDLTPEDVDHDLIEQAKIVYFDSYLWLSDSGCDTIHYAAAAAKGYGAKVAVALNDAGLVERNRERFLALVTEYADIVVGDRGEFMALFGTKTFEETVDAVKALGITASITAGKQGADVVADGQVIHIPTKKVQNVVDTNGAGDQFAAGFIYGLAQGKSPEDSGHQGAQWAADVIQHKGAEPKVGKNAASPVKGPVP